MMDAERLTALAEIYGGDVRLWPEADRDAARAFIAHDRDGADRILFEARQLDAALDHLAPVTVSHDLRERVIALAAAQGIRERRGWRFRLDPLTWLSGAGMAAAVMAGVMVGMNTLTYATADVRADAVLYQASLGAMDDTEVLG
jgi:hypothetical protein